MFDGAAVTEGKHFLFSIAENRGKKGSRTSNRAMCKLAKLRECYSFVTSLKSGSKSLTKIFVLPSCIIDSCMKARTFSMRLHLSLSLLNTGRGGFLFFTFGFTIDDERLLLS